eukprot:3729115-Pleurochrysis_carterae.AAC.2
MGCCSHALHLFDHTTGSPFALQAFEKGVVLFKHPHVLQAKAHAQGRTRANMRAQPSRACRASVARRADSPTPASSAYLAQIWLPYLTKFVARYGGTKLERARDLFEQAPALAGFGQSACLNRSVPGCTVS